MVKLLIILAVVCVCVRVRAQSERDRKQKREAERETKYKEVMGFLEHQQATFKEMVKKGIARGGGKSA